MGILLVYDVSDRETFRSVRNWMSNIQMYASNDVNKVRHGFKRVLLPPIPSSCVALLLTRSYVHVRVCFSLARSLFLPLSLSRYVYVCVHLQILVGNKCDMDESKRRVQTSEGEALAAEFGIPFFETSAMANINVDTAFTHIAKCVKDRLSTSEDRKKSMTQSTLNLNSGASAEKKSCC